MTAADKEHIRSIRRNNPTTPQRELARVIVAGTDVYPGTRQAIYGVIRRYDAQRKHEAAVAAAYRAAEPVAT